MEEDRKPNPLSWRQNLCYQGQTEVTLPKERWFLESRSSSRRTLGWSWKEKWLPLESWCQCELMPGECMPFCGLSPSRTWQKGRRRERQAVGSRWGTDSIQGYRADRDSLLFNVFSFGSWKKKIPALPNVYQNIISLGVAAVGLRTCPKWGACDILSRLPKTHLHRSTTSLVASTRAGVLELLV